MREKIYVNLRQKGVKGFGEVKLTKNKVINYIKTETNSPPPPPNNKGSLNNKRF